MTAIYSHPKALACNKCSNSYFW